VLLFHLFHGMNPPSKVGELSQFFLDALQPLMSLAVGNLSLRLISTLSSILGVQFLKVCYFGAEHADFFSKDGEMIHT
jgi:hypothetical protein